jgi:H+-transporting ATPase
VETHRPVVEIEGGEKGLTEAEAEERLARYGRNELIEKKRSPVVKFLLSFWGPIPWMIEIAAVLSGVIHHWEDFSIITILLVINAVVGFWQENRADNAIELLKKKLAVTSRVMRDGKWVEKPASDLVPGDLIRMRMGDIVPADVKLVEGEFLQADESALTGESLPVEKGAGDTAYSGSIIRQGEMTALVTATGMETYFGKTASLVQTAKTQSHFQKAVVKIGNFLIIIAAFLVFAIFIFALFRHESLIEFLQFAMVLFVASIPAALPAVLSVTMAAGAIALARKEAIVSRLSAIEEMAGMDILCSDKTGTITKNELTVADVVPFGKFGAKDVLLYAALASREENRDPIDGAVFNAAYAVEEIARSRKDFHVSAFKPFDPIAKRTEATVRRGLREFRTAKGAPQVILEMVEKRESVSAELGKRVDDFATKGYRALAVAKAEKRRGWEFVGLIPLYDPPREDSAPTLKAAQAMGIDVKMVTGDHTAIARETAKAIGLKPNIVPAEMLFKESRGDVDRLIEEANGFAQVFPEHKFRIVEMLQGRDHIVGMTGDGVNDAPALKKADAGIAVAGATDAAKSAASIVLTKPGLSVIVDAIKQSRKIFQRMSNYAVYRIAETIRVLLFITVSIIVFQFYPVTALMIVLLALLNDAPIMTISLDNVRYSDKPDRWNMRTTLGIAAFLGLIGVFSSFGIFYIGKEVFGFDNAVLQSFIYLKLSVAGHLTVFVARTRGHFWSVKPAKALLIAVVATQIIATLITVYGFLLPAMGWLPALFVWGYSLAAFLITDFLKVGMYGLLGQAHVPMSAPVRSDAVR